MNDRLVWIDCEMTGLDLEQDGLIEIACLVTDGELNILDEGIYVIIKPPPEAVDAMTQVVRDMPQLDAYLHYRMVDVSSIKELARRWYPRAYFASPPKHGGHRALADILESIRELRYYRAAVFVPEPGPDTTTARKIAARYAGPEPAPAGPGDSGPAQ